VHSDSLSKTTTVELPVTVIAADPGEVRRSSLKKLGLITLLCLVLSSAANHAVAHWLGLSRTAPWTRAEAVYRRIGPQSGPQIFCAGSSLLVSGLSWPQVSDSLGQGVENWTVAGSSPEVWEVFQQQPRASNLTIIGISVYDLNEMRLTPERANFVPFGSTVADLWSSRTNSDLRHRILNQYAISYVRVLYPLAGDGDKVLNGLRTKAADLLGQKGSLQEREGIVVEKKGVLDVQDTSTSLGDWSSARVLRRLEALRAENHGIHEFSAGPKSRAFRRVLLRAQQQGRVIVVVLPVSRYYADAFLNQNSISVFEQSLRQEMVSAPQATLVRLDQVPGISDNRYFFDLVHLNSSGRQMATRLFLQEVNKNASPVRPQGSLAMRVESDTNKVDRTYNR